MIVLTTLRGDRQAINEELIERIEANPETRVVLSTGTHYIVAESVDRIVKLCQLQRAEVHVLARELMWRSKHIGATSLSASLDDTATGEGDLVPFDRPDGRKSGAPGPRRPR